VNESQHSPCALSVLGVGGYFGGHHGACRSLCCMIGGRPFVDAVIAKGLFLDTVQIPGDGPRRSVTELSAGATMVCCSV